MTTLPPTWDANDDLGEFTTHPDDYADPWQSRRSRLGFWRLVRRGVLFTVVTVCGLLVITWATGWAADAVARYLP